MTRRRKDQSLDSKLVAYSAMAGAVLAGGHARAADCNLGVKIGTVCYTDIPDQTMIDSGTIQIDVDGNGDYEFNVKFFLAVFTDDYYIFTVATAWLTPRGGLDMAAGVLGGFTSSTRGPYASDPGALVMGDRIGEPGTGDWKNTPWILGERWDYGTVWGNFPGKGQRFAGIDLRLDASEVHFGWIRVTVHPGVHSITVHDFAFELTPDTPCATDLTVVFEDGFESGDPTA